MNKSHSRSVVIKSIMMALTFAGGAPTFAAIDSAINFANTPNKFWLTPWTGFYGGLNIGGLFNNVKLTSQHLGFTDLTGTCDKRVNFSSFISGAQLGYSYQLPNQLVLGVEGNVTYNTTQSDSFLCNCPINALVSDQFSIANRMQGSFRGRIGYALNQYNLELLPFITAGVSFANVNLRYNNEGVDHYSSHGTPAGWLIGTGIEWAFLNHWSVRAEYFYTDYGNAMRVTIPDVYGLYDPNGKASARLNGNYIAIAVNYWI